MKINYGYIWIAIQIIICHMFSLAYREFVEIILFDRLLCHTMFVTRLFAHISAINMTVYRFTLGQYILTDLWRNAKSSTHFVYGLVILFNIWIVIYVYLEFQVLYLYIYSVWRTLTLIFDRCIQVYHTFDIFICVQWEISYDVTYDFKCLKETHMKTNNMAKYI